MKGEPREDTEKVNILICDDRDDKLLALESILTDLRQNIVKVNSGAEALRALLKDEYAVILLDVNMPNMDGFETAALIRQRKNSEYTPIIFVTSVNTTETHASLGYSIGAVDYIFTPVVPEILRAKVAVFVDLYRKNAEIRRQGEWLLAEAQRRASDLESRQRHLLDRLDVGVFRCSLDGKLLETNLACRRLLGIKSWDTTTQVYIQELLPPDDDADKLSGNLKDHLKVLERDIQISRRDGTKKWISLSWTDSTDQNGAIFIDGLIEDISERKTVEEALLKKAQELARSNDDLEQFAYIASHDLKEPLRGISSFSSLLASRYGGKLDETADEFLGFIVDSVKRMEALVNDLLGFARIKRSETTFETVETEELLRQAVFGLNAVVEREKAVITNDPLPQVKCNPTLMRQLFQNLIGNGLKFCRGEAPKIHVSAKKVTDGWEFSIADNGIGIAKEYHEHIFGIFKRLHGQGEYTGTGIGLAFCRKIIQLHGGKIWVESEPGKGATFHFQICTPEATIEEQNKDEVFSPEEISLTNGKSGEKSELSGLNPTI